MGNAISFVKNFKNGNGWEQTAITEEEERALQESIQQKNEELMRKCFETAEKAVGKYTSPYSRNIEQIAKVACHLYDSNRIHAQQIFDAFIQRKIYLLRNGNGEDE